ncbi:MAG: hypothetical protein IKP95_05610 [Ruminococcus sp.]|nr:hypothetical protein [Ruminococcus sp.]
MFRGLPASTPITRPWHTAASDGDGIYIIKNDKVAGHIGVEEGLETAVILRVVTCTGGYLYVTSNGMFFDSGRGKVRRLRNFPYSNCYDIIISENKNCYITSSAGLFIVSEEKLIEDGKGCIPACRKLGKGSGSPGYQGQL